MATYKRLLIFFFLLSSLHVYAQSEENCGEGKVKSGLHGFVKNDVFFDSRQTVNVREGHFLLYPQNVDLDFDGNDINAKPSLNMLSIQTRLSVGATGPDIWGASTSGYIEGEFFGMTNPDINGFRLRHAYVRISWLNSELMVGQFWHPMFHTKSCPMTISFNTGVPFQPFTRNPQIRFTHRLGNISIMGTTYWQRDFANTGPDGVSSIYMRNSSIPGMNLRLEYHLVSEVNNELLIGGSSNYKVIQPRIETATGFSTSTKFGSTAFSAYMKFITKKLTGRLMGVYAQDAYDMIMLGGYAVKEVSDPIRQYEEYTTINTRSIWASIYTNSAYWQYGLFAGFTENLGSRDEIVGDIYARGSNIAYVYRLSPRVIYNAEKIRVAGEVEYTTAGYATKDGFGIESIDEFGVVTESQAVSNLRVLVGMYYFF
ncbi:MAG: hypothetical protein ABFS32_11530 [Bacteroidota bacterium]